MAAVLCRTSAGRTRRVIERFTLFCRDCGKPMLYTTDMGYALDFRDHHGVEAMHHVEVWINVAGRTFRLAGALDARGRELDLEK